MRDRDAARGRVVVYAFGVRRGKPAMLNDLLPRATGSIVVLADALELDDLDYSEFEASYDSVTLALASHLNALAAYRG